MNQVAASIGPSLGNRFGLVGSQQHSGLDFSRAVGKLSLVICLLVPGVSSGKEVPRKPSDAQAVLVDLLTKPGLFPIPLPDLAERLKIYSPLKEETPIAGVTDFRFFAGRTREIARIEIVYQLDEKKAWRFSTAKFFLLPEGQSVRDLREQIARAIKTRLGRPAWINKKPRVGMGWRLHDYWELMVSEEKSEIETIPNSTDHLEVTIFEPQGDAE
jgi:hypothetical protein